MIARYAFSGGIEGAWTVQGTTAVSGEALGAVERIDVGLSPPGGVSPRAAAWVLEGVTSHLRYTTGQEVATLRGIQAGLGRPEARAAAMIPIKKSAAWWDLPQDTRRAIFEETSHHTAIGLDYLPQIARRLHHCRDLGQPFDFITWFEFAPAHGNLFDDMLGRLRETAEWGFVEREIDIRLTLAS